ncbi:MAG: hypothetical protein ACUVRH_07260 [Candidatus Bipolaricaulia bacterium]
MAVKYIGRGGEGSEARIEIELRTEFPGIGGTIYTYQAIPTALRQEHHPSPKSGHRAFLRHAILKKLEDYFFMKGVYGYAHITRPLGSFSSAYLYEWAFGLDGFPWFYQDSQDEVPVRLDDWGSFIEAFAEIGIDMQLDCTDPDDGRLSKNIVHELARPIGQDYLSPHLNCLWKRVDFGERSIRIDFERLQRFLHDREGELRTALRHGRYELIQLASKYLVEGDQMDPRELGRLEVLALDYRLSTLRHLNARGVGPENSREIELVPEDQRL